MTTRGASIRDIGYNAFQGVRSDQPAATTAVSVGAYTIIRQSFPAALTGNPDDVTVYAAGALPFRMRIANIWGYVATAVGAVTVNVRSAAGGAGTDVGTVAFGATGYIAMTPVVANTTIELTPGATIGLFLRRSNDTVAGEVLMLVQRTQ